MAILNFSDVLKNVGLDPKEVKLIRHAFIDAETLWKKKLLTHEPFGMNQN